MSVINDPGVKEVLEAVAEGRHVDMIESDDTHDGAIAKAERDGWRVLATRYRDGQFVLLVTPPSD